MKELYYFIVWLSKKFNITNFIFFTAIIADIASFFFPYKSPISLVLILYGMVFPFILSLKYLIYDTIVELWSEYQKEKADLLEKLKRDD